MLNLNDPEITPTARLGASRARTWNFFALTELDMSDGEGKLVSGSFEVRGSIYAGWRPLIPRLGGCAPLGDGA
jgi:hypothetical protein